MSQFFGVDEARVKEEYPHSERPELYRAPEVDIGEVRRRYPSSERPELYGVTKQGRGRVRLLDRAEFSD